MNTLAVVNLIICITALAGALAGPWALSKWNSWRSATVDPPGHLDESEMDDASKKLISAAKALLIARKRAEDNPKLKAAIEQCLTCLPDFVCQKGAA